MKKILAISILLALAVSSGAFAASARWNALGGEQRFIIDTTNYTVYAGRITMFGNALFIIPMPDFRDNNNASGALINFKDCITLGLHYNLASRGAKNLGSALAAFGDDNEHLSALSIKAFPDIFLGIKMANASVGIRVAAAMDSSADSATLVEEEFEENDVVVSERTHPIDEITSSANALDLSVGASVYDTPVGDLDLGLRVGIQSFSQEDPNADAGAGTEISSTGGMDLNFDARLNAPLNANCTLVPILNVNTGSLPSAEYDKIAAPSVTEVSYMNSDIGLGLRRAVKKKGFVLVGVKGGYGTTTSNPTRTILEKEFGKVLSREKHEVEETIDTSMSATVLAGVEYPIKNWLIARGGVNVEFVSFTDEIVVIDKTRNFKMDEEDIVDELVRKMKTKDVGYYYNMGIRAMVGGLIIDVILARNILHRGPYFVTGATGNWGTNVCITYKF